MKQLAKVANCFFKRKVYKSVAHEHWVYSTLLNE